MGSNSLFKTLKYIYVLTFALWIDSLSVETAGSGRKHFVNWIFLRMLMNKDFRPSLVDFIYAMARKHSSRAILPIEHSNLRGASAAARKRHSR
jgi:hypothetical protein